jgi:hypothetical protein
MRTTLDLPEKVVKDAKIMAVNEGVPLKAIVTRALIRETESARSGSKPWEKLRGSVVSFDLEPEESAYDEGYDGPPPHDPIWKTGKSSS